MYLSEKSADAVAREYVKETKGALVALAAPAMIAKQKSEFAQYGIRMLVHVDENNPFIQRCKAKGLIQALESTE